ncbi:cation:proton antiporter [Nitrosomonas ureae]|uniref:Sodium/proton antiporter, CPA1 family n=1 Tax=Nitrosomonas ureae TaxID=44577 RepID=A0A286AKK6_9PROT|nr:sodium:proton antiporter [Nitrosomonas ureae]SOD22437.1 sodium/proton antiporter, CPA1 family [Nitrosomonas ureae]
MGYRLALRTFVGFYPIIPMNFIQWMGLVGALLLLMGLSSAYIHRLPISTSTIYLATGLLISSVGFDLIDVNFVEWAVWFEHLTEIAVIVSLFISGLKLRLPLKNPAWTAAYRLAAPVMLACIAGVAWYAHFVFGFDWASAFLLGAVLAPTDPVLASTVSVNHASDHDRMRYGLSGEAGFNDGAAFPFVIFALMWMEYGELGGWVGGWALHYLIWAIPAGLLLGYFLGKGIGRLAIWLRNRHGDRGGASDFLALALIALSYAGAETIFAWGFLAAFAAGLGFRRAEIKVVNENPAIEYENNNKSNKSNDSDLAVEINKVGESQVVAEHESIAHPPAEEFVGRKLDKEELKQPSKAAGIVVAEIISFGDTAERLLEAMLVVLVGISLALYWDGRAVLLAFTLFIVIRPLAMLLFLIKTPTGKVQRLMIGWFGIRGIGSLYYLSYSLNHGLTDKIDDTVGITLSIVALSILIHGISSQPILNYYERLISSEQTKSNTR